MEYKKDYKLEINKFRNKKKFCMLVGILLFIVILFFSIFFVSKGAMNIGFDKSWKIVFSKMFNLSMLDDFKKNELATVWLIRLPRIIVAITVGAGLAVAGTIFQSLLRNPLADPYTLGVSTGAAFGASLAIILNIVYNMMFSTTIFAFIFAFITLILVITISNIGGGIYSTNLIISGIIIGSILSSGISFIKMVAGESVGAIVFWLMGSLASKTWMDVSIVVPVVLIASIIAFYFANDLNVMTMGEHNAKSLGINTKFIRLIYLVLGSCITASCVAVSGIIGFVGLVVPHILRFWLSSDNRVLIPLAALLGGLILLVADNITRLYFISEIPVGVLTTLIGGPFFIYIFVSRQKR